MRRYYIFRSLGPLGPVGELVSTALDILVCSFQGGPSAGEVAYENNDPFDSHCRHAADNSDRTRMLFGVGSW